MSVYTKDIDQLLPSSIETSICEITRHIDHSKQGKHNITWHPISVKFYIPHTAAEETNREKELMNRERDRVR